MAMEMIKNAYVKVVHLEKQEQMASKKKNGLMNHKEYQRELQRVSTTIIATALYQNLESTEPKKMS